MGAVLNLVQDNLHELRVDETRMLFHIPSSSLFALDPLTAALIDRIRRQSLTAEALIDGLRTEFDANEVAEAIRELVALELIDDGRPAGAGALAHTFERFPLTTVVLNVNTGCNLACTYCYKEDLAVPAKGEKMAFETARASFELLMRQAKDRDRVNVVFFGAVL